MIKYLAKLPVFITIVVVTMLWIVSQIDIRADVTVGDLTATVTKIMPTENRAGMHLKLVDASLPVGYQTRIDKDYWVEYSPSEGLNVAQRTKILNRMQEDIDRGGAIVDIFKAPALGTAATFIENNLNL